MPLKIIHIHPADAIAERLRGGDLVIPNAMVPVGEKWIVLPDGRIVFAHRAGKP